MNASTEQERATTVWTIDPQHSSVGFEVKHMMFSRVRGHFTTLDGTIELAEDGLEHSRVKTVVDAASIDTGQEDRDEHLRSADFFDVERFPTLRFESRSVEPSKDGRFKVTGDLEIRGVTREVQLDVVRLGSGTDPWGNERTGFRGSTTIDRRDFELTWNQALEAGGVLVGNDVRISVEIQAVETAE